MTDEPTRQDFRDGHSRTWDTIGKISRAVGIAGMATAGIGAVFGNRNVARIGAAVGIGGMAGSGIAGVMNGDRPRPAYPWGGFGYGMPMLPGIADLYAWRASQMAYFNDYIMRAMIMGRWAHMAYMPHPRPWHRPPPPHHAPAPHHGGPAPHHGGPAPHHGGPAPNPRFMRDRGGRA